MKRDDTRPKHRRGDSSSWRTFLATGQVVTSEEHHHGDPHSHSHNGQFHDGGYVCPNNVNYNRKQTEGKIRGDSKHPHKQKKCSRSVHGSDLVQQDNNKLWKIQTLRKGSEKQPTYRIERKPVVHNAGYDQFTMKTLTNSFPSEMASRDLQSNGRNSFRIISKGSGPGSSTLDNMMMGDMFELAPDFPVIRGDNERKHRREQKKKI